MKERSINCDVLRIMACFFVISVHSLRCVGFYDEVTQGSNMLFLNIARCLFEICVPIFIVLTGYLLTKREFNKNHICKLGRIVIVYILCSIVCLFALHFIENRDVLRLKDYIFQILSFEAAPYSWYVNMYFGLFLLLPFLNVLWNNLKNKKQKQYLLLVLIIIAVLPNTLNIFNFNDLNWG